MFWLLITLVFGPLVGATIAGLAGRALPSVVSQAVTTGFLVLSAVLAWTVFPQALAGTLEEQTYVFAPFINIGDFQSNWSLRLDTLSAVMLVVVTTVSALVHVYSWGYMAEDPHRPRFFAYLSLFTFAMLMLVTADNQCGGCDIAQPPSALHPPAHDGAMPGTVACPAVQIGRAHV